VDKRFGDEAIGRRGSRDASRAGDCGVIAGPPREAIPPPDSLLRIAADDAWRAVWVNELGGVTYAVERAEPVYVKWAPTALAPMLDAEALRLQWARRHTPVPELVDRGDDADGAWLVTRALPYDNAVSERWAAAPSVAVRAIGEGLRAFHDALPVEQCPFSWSTTDRVADTHRRAEAGELDPARWDRTHRALSVDDALEAIAVPPAVDRLVVCHGDACAPNTLLGDDGRWAAHVDLAFLGVGDRWADLAIATWSLEWNYGPGWEPLLLSSYGVEPDLVRTRYYRLLWDLGP
jgi:kanamycin kinase